MDQFVRPMMREDLTEIAELSVELGYPAVLSDLQIRFQRLRTLPHHELFVYANQGVQGFMHLEIVDDLIEEQKVEVKAIVVRQSERGKNIGHAFIEEAKRWAKAKQLHTIYLSCNIVREKAHAFYLREGFQQTRSSHFFELKL